MERDHLQDSTVVDGGHGGSDDPALLADILSEIREISQRLAKIAGYFEKLARPGANDGKFPDWRGVVKPHPRQYPEYPAPPLYTTRFAYSPLAPTDMIPDDER